MSNAQIGYDEDKGKVADIFFCPRHHPKKEFIESLIETTIDVPMSDFDNSSVGNTGGGKEGHTISSYKVTTTAAIATTTATANTSKKCKSL